MFPENCYNFSKRVIVIATYFLGVIALVISNQHTIFLKKDSVADVFLEFSDMEIEWSICKIWIKKDIKAWTAHVFFLS